MSIKRHKAIFDRRGVRGASITTLAHDYAHGHFIPNHFHDRDQLVFAHQGVMTVRAAEGMWIVPTHRAVWIPAKIPHSITMSGRVSMRTIYLKQRLARALPRKCCVVNVSPLLKELILHANTFGALHPRRQSHAHLVRVIVDQLEASPSMPLQLPNPSDPRAMRVTHSLSNDPGGKQALSDICRKAGASKRTVERLFQAETRMTLGKWRQQLRLMHAIQLVAAGEKVTFAALEAGYSSPSAFISMFRKVLGTTPRRYLAD